MSTAATIGPAHPDIFLGSGATANQASVTFYNGSNVTADTAFMITALCQRRSSTPRVPAALAGVVISALALGSLQRHRPPAAPAAVDPVVQASRQAAVSRCGSFQPGRGKWQV